MIAARSGKSHAMAWVLSILLVPLIYLGTFPPIACLGIAHSKDYSSKGTFPEWVRTYGVPYSWAQRTSLKRILDQYLYWWSDRIIPPRKIRVRDYAIKLYHYPPSRVWTKADTLVGYKNILVLSKVNYALGAARIS